MPHYASEVFDRSRFFLNDTGGSYFTDDVLLPALQAALEDLKSECYTENIPITNAESPIGFKINVGVLDIGGLTGPPLPTDLIEIQGLLERTYGSSEQFIPITRSEFLPELTTPYQSLVNWAWENQIVKFNGAITIREVQMNYIADAIGIVQNSASVIKMINSVQFLAYRTAALSAGFRGEDDEREAKLNNNAGIELNKLLDISTKGKQSIPVRRRPFMANYKRNAYIIR